MHQLPFGIKFRDVLLLFFKFGGRISLQILFQKWVQSLITWPPLPFSHQSNRKCFGRSLGFLLHPFDTPWVPFWSFFISSGLHVSIKILAFGTRICKHLQSNRRQPRQQNSNQSFHRTKVTCETLPQVLRLIDVYKYMNEQIHKGRKHKESHA